MTGWLLEAANIVNINCDLTVPQMSPFTADRNLEHFWQLKALFTNLNYLKLCSSDKRNDNFQRIIYSTIEN